MTPEQAKTILALHRPGVAEADDAQTAEALALARRDAALGEWFARHQTLQQSLQSAWRRLPVPEGLAERILAGHKIVQPTFLFLQRHRMALAAAAALVLLA